jgi:hypothetical protein
MADTSQSNDSSTLTGMMQHAGALDDAILRARAELDAIHAAASEADALASAEDDVSIHEVPGVGRYAVSRKHGWRMLLELVRDAAVDIDFNSDKYPAFDAIVVKATGNSPFLDDPLFDDGRMFQGGFEDPKFVRLRENLAAVRNVLMETYYVNSPEGMTPDKAKQAMAQIAAFVGEGLGNNYLYYGLIPNHKWNKPFIDITKASAPNGEGAQYIYDKILEMQRQSTWMRPFAAVAALFGGAAPVDWMLPNVPVVLGKRGHHANNIAAREEADATATSAALAQLEAERASLQQQMDATAMAIDLEAMGNQLLHTAEQLQGIGQLADPVRRDAVEIAKDILRKLKVSFGNIDLNLGLQLKPSDDMAALGAVQGVAMVYEKLLAWGRGIDASIVQHPSVMAATMAVGQMGYLAKLEALRIAKSVGNGVLADRIASRISAMPDAYKAVGGLKFGELLDRVEGGIDTVLNRIQEINGPGASVGHTPYKELGNYMSATPIAGLGAQVGAETLGGAQKKNAAIIQTQELAEKAQVQRIQTQAASRARQQGGQVPAATAARGASSARQALQQVRQAIRQATTRRVAVNQQTLVNQRNLTIHGHDEDGHHHDAAPTPPAPPAKIDPKLVNPEMMKKFRAATNTLGLTDAPVLTGKAAYKAMKKAATGDLGSKDKAGTPVAASSEEEKKRADAEKAYPQPPHKGGHGR